MAIHKLILDDLEEVDYQLIAIHSTIEDYRLAYLINQKLPVLLSKNKIGIQDTLINKNVAFSRFTFEDLDKEIHWNLIENKQEVSVLENKDTQSLFQFNQEINNTYYFLPEFKKVDYFLKIEGCDMILQNKITTILNTIERVSTVYIVNKSKIKAKNNLIF